MNKDINDVTLQEVFRCISIINGLLNNGIIIIDAEKQAAVFCFDEASKFLEKQNLDLKNKNEELESQVAELKNEINKIAKKELKIMQMLRSIELCTLTKERIDQIEQVMFELEGNND